MAKQDSGLRQALYRILSSGTAGSQEEICEALKKDGFEVTQSTVSRSLRKFGAIKAISNDGTTSYKLSESFAPPATTSSISDLVLAVINNGAMMVVKTTPGSASLVARHIDLNFSHEILGTIAGDDTIFVAPKDYKRCPQTCSALKNVLDLPEN